MRSGSATRGSADERLTTNVDERDSPEHTPDPPDDDGCREELHEGRQQADQGRASLRVVLRPASAQHTQHAQQRTCEEKKTASPRWATHVF